MTERNNYVAQQLGVEVKAVPVDDVLATMRQEMLVPSDTFDIAMPFLNACAVLAQENAFYDLREFEQEGILDLSAPWYDQNANASISIENRSYFTVSDMSIDLDEVRRVLAADRTVKVVFVQRSKGYQDRQTLSAHEIDALYELVKSMSEAYVVIDNNYGEFCEVREPKGDRSSYAFAIFGGHRPG